MPDLRDFSSSPQGGGGLPFDIDNIHDHGVLDHDVSVEEHEQQRSIRLDGTGNLGSLFTLSSPVGAPLPTVLSQRSSSPVGAPPLPTVFSQRECLVNGADQHEDGYATTTFFGFAKRRRRGRGAIHDEGHKGDDDEAGELSNSSNESSADNSSVCEAGVGQF